MKKLYILVFALLAINSANAQIQSDCTILPDLLSFYDRDIKQLAICRMFQIHSPDTVMVRIPKDYTDTIAEGMAGILNADSLPESDSVFNLYCIHNLRGCPGEYNGFLVKVDTSYSWTNAWQNMQTMTGDPLMDTIIVRYSLFIQQFYNWSDGCVAVISSDSTWNFYALCDSLEMVPGVIYAHKNSMGGDAAYIGYNVIADERYYNFAYKWGDCIAGCIHHYIWKFKVSPECVVTYLGVEANNGGEWGDPLPPPINCNVFTFINDENISKMDFKIFPNPCSQAVNISNDNNTIFQELSIYNQTGQKVLQGKPVNNTLDISKLRPGMCIVELVADQGKVRKKLMVE